MEDAKKLRVKGKYREAAETLRKLPPSFFASEQWAILSYHLGDKESGIFHVTVAELANKDSDHQWAVNNSAAWYAEKIGAERTLGLVPKKLRPKYSPCNPSLVPAGTGWWALVRTVNWRQKGAKEYVVDPEFNGVCMTTNYLLRLGPDLGVQSEVEVADPALITREMGSRRVKGMEDMRLYAGLQNCDPKPPAEGRAEQLCASFTLINNSRCKEGHLRIGCVELRSDGTTSEVRELASPLNVKCEKNWLPFVFRGRPSFFYGYDPITVVDSAGKICFQRHCPYNCSSFRGSAGPLPYKGGYLVVVHECGFFEEGSGKKPSRLYFHRFVKYDEHFGFVDVSRPFVFDHRGVEFCSTMAAAGEGLFYLGCGIEDREARIVVISAATIDSMWLNFPQRLKAYLAS